MADITLEAPTTLVPQPASPPLNNVGDALEAYSAKNRKALVASIMSQKPEASGPEPDAAAPPDPGESTPPEPGAEAESENPAEHTDLSQEAPNPDENASSSSDSVPDTEPDTEPQADTEDAAPHWEEPEWVEKWKGKQVAKTKAAEEAAQQLKVRVAELEAQNASPAAPPPDVVQQDADVKAAIDAEQKASDGLNKVRELQRQVRTDPETVANELRKRGATLPPDADAESISLMLQDLREDLHGMRMDAITQKRMAEQRATGRFQQKLVQSYQEAAKEYPWLADQKHPNYLVALEAIKQAPWLKQMENGYQWLAYAVEGKAARDQLRAAATKPAAKPKGKRPPNIPAPRSAPRPQATNPMMVSSEVRQKAFLENDPAARRAILRNAMGKS